MILHYIQISLRNLRKYKMQTAISICSMAVSLTLMALVSSVMLKFKPFPFIHQPFFNRIEQLSFEKDGSIFASYDDLNLILNNHLKNAEEIHYLEGANYFMNVTSDPDSDNERSLLSLGITMDSDFLKFIGYKSAITGGIIESLSENEVIITDWLSKKLFKEKNPIGRYLNLEYGSYDGFKINKNFKIKDVLESQTNIYTPIPSRCNVFLLADHLSKESHASCYFILREGASRDSLSQELKDLIPGRDIQLRHFSDLYSQEENRILTVTNMTILFLFLFVLMSFSNFLRQQTQLFRLREREVALRTCVGCTPKSLFVLFSTEIMIVILLTLAIAIALVCIISDYFLTHFSSMLDEIRVDFDGAIAITLITSAILMIIGLFVVAFTIRRIRRDQTGLALRMKPQSKHTMRNLGLTFQLSISILFIWFSIIFCLSIKSIKQDNSIPDNVDKFQRCLSLHLDGIFKEERDAINRKIDSLKSIEKVYKNYYFTSYFDNENRNGSTQFIAFFQSANDVVDFYDLDINELPGLINKDRNILINEEFKQMLIDKNLWNGKTVTLPFNDGEEYEVRGIINGQFFMNTYTDKCVVITDASISDSSFNRIILPQKGKERETIVEIQKIFKEVCPSRIDLSVENWFERIVPAYNMVMVMVFIIVILSIISVITTMACIYSAVSLDTRRRRKEMALRKLNGATPKVIAMIFARSYIWIITVSILITLPLSIILFDNIPYQGFRELGNDKMALSLIYVMTVILIIAVTALTIAWKIRDIMKADPIDYLKE